MLPTPPPCPVTPPTTTTTATEEPVTRAPKPQTHESTISTSELITDEPTSTKPINEVVTIPTDESLSPTTDDMPVTDQEATTDDSIVTPGGVSQPLLVGTATAAVSVGIILLLSLTILVSVIIYKQRSKSFDVTQQSTLQLGVTNRLQGSLPLFVSNGRKELKEVAIIWEPN